MVSQYRNPLDLGRTLVLQYGLDLLHLPLDLGRTLVLQYGLDLLHLPCATVSSPPCLRASSPILSRWSSVYHAATQFVRHILYRSGSKQCLYSLAERAVVAEPELEQEKKDCVRQRHKNGSSFDVGLKE
jgi:hypothetical protein